MAFGLLLVGGAALAGCTPGPIPLVYGQPVVSAPAGFTGTTRFGCGGSLYLDVTGAGGGSITVTATGLPPFIATGGPLAYQSAEAGYRIEFQPGYASLALISLRGAPQEPCRA